MAGRLTLAAEVAGRADDPLAEVVLPEPVDHHAGGHRVVGLGDPARQLEPAAPLDDPGPLPCRERLREMPGDATTGLRVTSPDVDPHPGSRDKAHTAALPPGFPTRRTMTAPCPGGIELAGKLLDLGPGLRGEVAAIVAVLDPEGALTLASSRTRASSESASR